MAMKAGSVHVEALAQLGEEKGEVVFVLRTLGVCCCSRRLTRSATHCCSGARQINSASGQRPWIAPRRKGWSSSSSG